MNYKSLILPNNANVFLKNKILKNIGRFNIFLKVVEVALTKNLKSEGSIRMNMFYSLVSNISFYPKSYFWT